MAATILIAEDASEVRRFLTQLLRQSGYEVLEAPDGPQALATAEGHPDAIDLLISDVVMPGMTGPELARRFAQRRPEARILFISGYSDAAALADIQQQPGTEYLRKPFSPKELLSKVRELLAS